MHRGLYGRVLVALAVVMLVVGVAIIAKAPGKGTKREAKGVAIIARAPIGTSKTS